MSKNFCWRKNVSRIFVNLSDFCPTFVQQYWEKKSVWQKFSLDKIFVTKPNFRQFCPTNFCPIMYNVRIEIFGLWRLIFLNIKEPKSKWFLLSYISPHYSLSVKANGSKIICVMLQKQKKKQWYIQQDITHNRLFRVRYRYNIKQYLWQQTLRQLFVE